MDPELIQVIELFVAALLALIAFMQHRQKKVAENDASMSKEIASMAIALTVDTQQDIAESKTETAKAKAETAEAQDDVRNVVSFFDPADPAVTSAPPWVPGRSYLMSTETKKWLTYDHPAEEKQVLLAQIAEAEGKKLATYTLDVPSAWYEIEYGLVRCSGKKIGYIGKYG